jgi:hypothetical protein
MSAPAFTPGPWRVDAEPYGSGMARFVRAGSGEFPLATMHGNPGPKAQTEANARLIATAPKLYELAEQFERVAEYELRNMQREKPEDDEGIRLRRLNLNLIRATLAEVRGEQ